MIRILLNFLLITIFSCSFVYAKQDLRQEAVEKTEKLVKEIAAQSYPEINLKRVRVKTFESKNNYFKARFSYTRFLTFQKMRHIIYVNPKVYQKNAPAEGFRGILAHELAHVLYYKKRNRLELLGLTRLISKKFTTKFERKADLDAISRGYGEDLIAYREWLYENIPDKKLDNKKRDYFTPEEIRILIPALEKNPKLIKKLKDDIPLNFEETQRAIS